MLLLLPVAFIAGLLSLLAPCTWPILPLVVGAGAAGAGRRRPAGVVVGLVATFVLATVALASLLATLGATTAGLRGVAVITLAVVALTLIVPGLGRRWSVAVGSVAQAGSRFGGLASGRDGFLGGLVVGAALGLLWVPCVGPIMAGVIAIAVTQGPSVGVLAIASAYAIGAAIPLLVVATKGRSWLRGADDLARREVGRRIVGVAMLVSCLMIATGADVGLQNAVAGALPEGWSSALYSVEKAPDVEERIRDLRTVTNSAEGGSAAGVVEPVDVSGRSLPAAIADTLPSSVPMSDLGAAPEFEGITAWINSDPLTLASLRGKVVLVHFWTFGCINCRNVQPYVKAWYERYHDAGLEIVGVHTPELSFEREIANVRDAVHDEDVRFPVAFDPDFTTWYRYSNSYWPAFYYVDRNGRIRFTHAGEGSYADQEQVIRQLLTEGPTAVTLP